MKNHWNLAALICAVTHCFAKTPQQPYQIRAGAGYSYLEYKIGRIETPVQLKSHGRLSKSLFRVGLGCLRSILTSTEKKLKEFHWAIDFLKDCKSTS